MIVPIILVALAVLVTFLVFRWLDSTFETPAENRPESQPNEDDPEFMAWINRKIRHLE